MKKNAPGSKEVGLIVGWVLLRYLFGTEALHYGYWTDEMALDKHNIAKAQENHSQFIISHIPPGAETILDVGCGVGTLAAKLLQQGYSVDCVSPSVLLTERAREILGDRSQIYPCGFEQMRPEKRYDVVLFSESFQYVKLLAALQQSLDLLVEGGHLLICDFFKTDAKGKSPVGGGHRLSRFHDAIAQFPFEPVKDIDITDQTAPTLDLVDDALRSVGLPIWRLVSHYLENKRPLISKFLKWKYEKKIEKITGVYLGGGINAEKFKIFKSYRLLIYKKSAS